MIEIVLETNRVGARWRCAKFEKKFRKKFHRAFLKREWIFTERSGIKEVEKGRWRQKEGGGKKRGPKRLCSVAPANRVFFSVQGHYN